MILTDLIRRFRTESSDKVEPYFWSDDEVTDWLNDAEQEAALRGRLLYESANSDVCQILIEEGVAVYPLHPAIYEISNMYFTEGVDSRRYPISLSSPESLDRSWPEWRERTGFQNTLCGGLYAIQSDNGIRIAPVPDKAGTLFLEGYRGPLEPMVDDDDTPEINAAHHRHLVHWALHKAFSIPDTESFDAERSAIAESEFTRYFGLRPDSDLRRSTREDETQTVKGFWV